MRYENFKLRKGDLSKLWVFTGSIAGAMIINHISLQELNSYIGNIVSLNGAIAWLPIAISYILSALAKILVLSKRIAANFNLTTFERCVTFFFVMIGNVLLAQRLEDYEASGMLILMYVFIIFPIQIVIIICIDTLIKIIKK